MKAQLRRLKTIQISAFGVGVEIETGELHKTFETGQDLFNSILAGKKGTKAAMFVLKLIFRTNFQVQCPTGLANSYIPRHARGKDGYVVSTPLARGITRELAYTIIRRHNRTETYWVPGHGLNIFRVSHPNSHRVAHFEEVTTFLEVSEIGKLTYSLAVGQ